MSLETSRLRITGVTGGPLRITGASLVNGAYELATAGGTDYELQIERQTMLSEILFIPGLSRNVPFVQATAVDALENPLTPIDYTDDEGTWRGYEFLNTDDKLIVTVGGSIQYRCIGGGGGGGGINLNTTGGGAGGGAGGWLEGVLNVDPGEYLFTIGSGGAGGVGANIGASGASTSGLGITAAGGFGGANGISGATGVNGDGGGTGGSGGGGGGAGTTGGTGGVAGSGTSFGFSGGNGFGGTGNTRAGGGGGGTTANGNNATSSVGGNGGNGKEVMISGLAYFKAGGGGGGTGNPTSGTVGLGRAGGGNGALPNANGGNASANSGSGGGGAGRSSDGNVYNGGNGGSGYFAIRYRIPAEVVPDPLEGEPKVVLPSAFNDYDIDVNVHLTDDGYEVNKTVDDFMPRTNSVYYVDDATGNDNNDGLTFGTAKKTITNAWANAAGTPRILISPGSYAIAKQNRSAILEGNGGQFEFSAGVIMSGGSDVKVGFRNFDVKRQLQIGNNTTAIFDAPQIASSEIRAIRGIEAGRVIIFDAIGNGARDVLSYTGDSHYLEVNCEIIDSGEQDGDNATTGHVDVKGICVGGVYAESYRNVADIENAKRLMFGSRVRDSKNPPGSTSRNISAGSTSANTTEIWLYGVDARGGATNELMTENGGKIYYDAATQFDTSSGDVTLFVPEFE